MINKKFFLLIGDFFVQMQYKKAKIIIEKSTEILKISFQKPSKNDEMTINILWNKSYSLLCMIILFKRIKNIK